MPRGPPVARSLPNCPIPNWSRAFATFGPSCALWPQSGPATRAPLRQRRAASACARGLAVAPARTVYRFLGVFFGIGADYLDFHCSGPPPLVVQAPSCPDIQGPTGQRSARGAAPLPASPLAVQVPASLPPRQCAATHQPMARGTLGRVLLPIPLANLASSPSARPLPFCQPVFPTTGARPFSPECARGAPPRATRRRLRPRRGRASSDVPQPPRRTMERGATT